VRKHSGSDVSAESGWWGSPVPVGLGSGFTVHHVSNNLQAADILLNRWPAQGGTKHRAARQAVLNAMERAHDRMLLEKARNAFADAAKEADILFG
jgi:hypothetical protein